MIRRTTRRHRASALSNSSELTMVNHEARVDDKLYLNEKLYHRDSVDPRWKPLPALPTVPYKLQHRRVASEEKVEDAHSLYAASRLSKQSIAFSLRSFASLPLSLAGTLVNPGCFGGRRRCGAFDTLEDLLRRGRRTFNTFASSAAVIAGWGPDGVVTQLLFPADVVPPVDRARCACGIHPPRSGAPTVERVFTFLCGIGCAECREAYCQMLLRSPSSRTSLRRLVRFLDLGSETTRLAALRYILLLAAFHSSLRPLMIETGCARMLAERLVVQNEGPQAEFARQALFLLQTSAECECLTFLERDNLDWLIEPDRPELTAAWTFLGRKDLQLPSMLALSLANRTHVVDSLAGPLPTADIVDELWDQLCTEEDPLKHAALVRLIPLMYECEFVSTPLERWIALWLPAMEAQEKHEEAMLKLPATFFQELLRAFTRRALPTVAPGAAEAYEGYLHDVQSLQRFLQESTSANIAPLD